MSSWLGHVDQSWPVPVTCAMSSSAAKPDGLYEEGVRRTAAGPPHTLPSDCVNLVRLRALGPLAGGVFHLLVLFQRAVAAHVDRRVMHEHVDATVVRGDEAKPLIRTEPLHGASSHLLSPSKTSSTIRALARIGCWLPATGVRIHSQKARRPYENAGAFTIANVLSNSAQDA